MSLNADPSETEAAIRHAAVPAHILDSIRQAVIATDLSGTITYWSRIAESVFGWPSSEVVGQNLCVITSATMSRRGVPKLLDEMRSGVEWEREFDGRRHDGTQFPVRITGSPMHDHHGTLSGMVGVVTDLTELRRKDDAPAGSQEGQFVEWAGARAEIDARKRAEAALRDSEARYRAIVDTAHEGIWLERADEHTLFVNARMAEQLGYHPDEIQGKAFTDFVHPDDREAMKMRLRRRRRGKSDVYDIRFLHKSGEIRWALVSAGPFYDGEGRFAGSLGMVTDITERKRAEREVTRSKDRYEQLMHHLDGIVWEGVADVETSKLQFTFVSDRLRKILGYEPQEWVENIGNWVTALHPDDIGWVPESCLEYSLTNRDHSMEYRMLDSNGQTVWLRDIVRIVEQRGDDIMLAGIMLDITERKQSEEALRKAKEKAEELARLKSAFLANMSHEIRTPLASIIGFSDTLVEEATGDIQMQAEMIRQGSERLKLTLDSVLALAQLESGSLHLSPVLLDVVEQVQDLLPMFTKMAEHRGLYLRLNSCVANCHTEADKGALSRVLTNLISNGLKFTDNGGVEVRISKEPTCVRLDISDTGVGISEAFMGQLFDEFKQESEGLTRSHEGVGLGLPITRRLVDLMGGEIDVSSEKGKGTTFTVRLPVSQRKPVAHRILPQIGHPA